MARLANAIKMGYFPTPEVVFQLISNWITPPSCKDEEEQLGWRLLDPCAGRGEATQLVQLVDSSCSCETWGVELSPTRADEATRVMDKVFNCDWRQTRVDRESVSLLWLNPPYDHDLDGEDRRLEIEFLRTAAPKLVDGGILIYVIPRHLLGYKGAAQRLAGHFEDLVVRRFPDGEYERFNQVIVLGRKKPWKTPVSERVESIRSLADESTVIPPLTAAPEPPWPMELPQAPADARFRRVSIPRREEIARAHAAGWPKDLLEAMRYRHQADFRPLLPPKKGHIAMLMSSGVKGIMTLPSKEGGEPLLIKGSTTREAVTRTETDDKGEEVTIVTYRPKSTVGIVDADGVRVLDEVEELKSFMEEYGDVLARQILAQNEPLYDLDPPRDVWEHLGRLSKWREPLRGQDEPGLLEVQKHVSIGLKRGAQKYGSALLQGEMGTGKTTAALATIDLLDAYPAIILVPPQVVDKWQREAREVIGPDVCTRELRRIGRTSSMDHGVNDVQDFIDDWEAGRLGEKAIAVVASTAAKLGPGWEGAVVERRGLPSEEDRSGFREALAAYKEARERLRTLKRQGVSDDELTAQRQRVRSLRRTILEEETVSYPVCPHCGRVQIDGSEEAPEPVTDFDEFDKHARFCNRPMDVDGDGESASESEGQVCGHALFEFGSRYRRWPIASYIKDKAEGFFKMLVVDEIHQYKGKSSDRGIAFARLCSAVPMRLGLTGTLYGGKASDIYWVLFRLGIKDIQQAFSYRSARQWVQQYGVLEEQVKGSSAGDDYGAFNATRRTRRYVREKPGVSPGILQYLVHNTIFLTLRDLGVALPPYKEEMALIEMSSEQAREYRRMNGLLKGLARSNSSYLSLWLQWSLARPNSAFRNEEVVKVWREDGQVVNREHLMSLPAPVGDDLLPKEVWLASYARAEMEQGRKVIVYARQTGTRDIQPRLKQVLTRAGLRTEVLKSSILTRKRESWVKDHAPAMDALVCNPRLVEIGLDLVQFATVVFYEINYSLYTTWQAMRRIWRLGQQKPVKVIFTAYHNTMEADALALMGLKQAAAQLLFGDEVGGALVPEDAGDFLTELARKKLADEDIADLETLFAAVRPVTTSALGCPTVQSPRLQAYSQEDLDHVRELWWEERYNGGSRRRRSKVPEAQLAMNLETELVPVA